MFLLSGCSTKTTPRQIKKFEEVLGKHNSETLSFLVQSFENDFLIKKYPNRTTQKAYENFLNDISKGDFSHYVLISKKNRKLFEESQLKWEIYTCADSIWIDDNLVKSFLSFKRDGKKIRTTEVATSIHKDENIDSVLSSYQERCDHNRQGKFIKAVKEIKSDNRFLEDYYHLKDMAGNLGNTLIPEMVSRNNANIEDYMVKRILVLELVY